MNLKNREREKERERETYQRRGSFIEYHDLWVLQDSSGYGHSLFFASAQPQAAFSH